MRNIYIKQSFKFIEHFSNEFQGEIEGRQAYRICYGIYYVPNKFKLIQFHG